ncbi:MAG: ATP synthase subunit C [Parcubacteria group bacterium GW2011_GWC2_44_22]|nr:MAG: ATP synthase subunit C [Parcubacteria group bacterium GW2011_GWC2_44_22]
MLSRVKKNYHRLLTAYCLRPFMLGLAIAVIGAAASVILAGIGSIVGTSRAGQAGAGIITEEPEKFGKVLLLQALPATQGIYGFIGAFWVIFKLNLLSGTAPEIPWATGLTIFFACMPVAVGGLISALYQGKVSVASLNIVTKKPDEAGKGIILAAMVETYAILGLLASILLINGINVG